MKNNRFGEMSILEKTASWKKRAIFALFGIHDIGMFSRAMYFKKSLDIPAVQKHLCQKQLRILDAGCGDGAYSFYLAQRFPQAQIKAIDINEKMLEENENIQKSAGIPSIKFSAGNAIDLSEKKYYDFIVCISVLIYCPYDKQIQILSNAASALKEGGIIYLFVTCKDWEKSLVLNPRFYKRMYDHFVNQHQEHIFSMAELSSLFEHLKLRIIRKKIVSGWWGELAWEIDKVFKEHNIERWKILVLPLLKLMCFIDALIDYKRGTGMIFVAQKI